MSLARLWRDEGKVQQARELLALVYGWFTRFRHARSEGGEGVVGGVDGALSWRSEFHDQILANIEALKETARDGYGVIRDQYTLPPHESATSLENTRTRPFADDAPLGAPAVARAPVEVLATARRLSTALGGRPWPSAAQLRSWRPADIAAEPEHRRWNGVPVNDETTIVLIGERKVVCL